MDERSLSLVLHDSRYLNRQKQYVWNHRIKVRNKVYVIN